MIKTFFATAFVFCLQINLQAQQPLTRILFILDASNSMNLNWGEGSRMSVAKEYLSTSVENLREIENLEIALRVYGHQTPVTSNYQDCEDTKLEVPFGVNNVNAIKSKIREIQAKGATPIARTLEQAADDFPDTNARNVIILITDGLESCDNDPCLVAKKLKDKGVNVTPFVIGVGMDLSYLDNFNCIGTYFEASTGVSFKKTLSKVIEKALLNTTVQINLNDIYLKPTETDVTMLLYKAGTKELKYSIMHTINRHGNPDTLILDPAYSYDILVNTIPKVYKKNVKIKRHVHNTIKIDAPQGFLKLKTYSKNKNFPLARIMQKQSQKTLHVQEFSSTEKYLVGSYHVEVLTLPRIYLTTQVKQSEISTLTIPGSGKLVFSFSNYLVAQIFETKDSQKNNWLYNFDSTKREGELDLQPGTYKIIYREKQKKSSSYSMEKIFKISSNKTTSIKL